MISLPKCSCSARSVDGRCFTCPECIAAASGFWAGQGVDQFELFEYLDSSGSVSALSRESSGLTRISEIKKFPEIVVDDLPF